MVFTVLPLFVLFTLSHGAIYISRGFGDGDVVFPKPDGSILPPHCSHFRAACRAEAEGRYEDAFKVYESKYEECGSHGWSIEGGSRGSLSFVVFKTTPCGLRVAVKRLTDPKECNILKLMTSKESQAACPGCFPAYYYFSNATKACYSEHVYSPLGFEQFLPIRQDLLIPRRLRCVLFVSRCNSV